MLDSCQTQSEFSSFNGFYKTAAARQVIYDLYKGKCVATGRKIDLADADIGHIIPQSDPAYFEEMFPGLDVHNIINLQLLHASENRKVGNTYIKNPLFLATAFAYTARIVRSRYHKVAQNPVQQVFDPQRLIEGLTDRHEVDFSASLSSAIPYRNYLLIAQDLVTQDYSRAIQGTVFEKQSSFIEYDAQNAFPASGRVESRIENGICRTVSARWWTDDIDKSIPALTDELNAKRGIHISRGLRKQGPPTPEEFCDIPDGEWIIIRQTEAGLDPIAPISRVDDQLTDTVKALKALRDRDEKPQIVGKVGRENIVLIKNAASLWYLHEDWACRGSDVVSLDAPIEFNDCAYTSDERFYAIAQRLKKTQEGSWAIMKKRDYTSLMKKLRKFAIDNIKAHRPRILEQNDAWGIPARD